MKESEEERVQEGREKWRQEKKRIGSRRHKR